MGEVLPEELGQAKAQGEGGGKDQPGIGHQAVASSPHRFRGMRAYGRAVFVLWQHRVIGSRVGSLFPGGFQIVPKPLSQIHRSTTPALASSRAEAQGRPSGARIPG